MNVLVTNCVKPPVAKECFSRTVQWTLIPLASVRWLYYGARWCYCWSPRRCRLARRKLFGLWDGDTLLYPMKHRYAIRSNRADEMRRKASRSVARVEIPRNDMRDLLCFRSVRAKPLSKSLDS